MIAVTTMQVLKFALVLVALFAGPAMARAWQRVAARPPRIEGDKLVVRHADVYVLLVLAVGLGGLGYLGSMVVRTEWRGWSPWLVGLAWTMSVSAGLLLLWLLVGLRVRLEFDAVGLRGRRALTGYRELRWQDIAVVRYSRRWKRLTIADGGGREVSVSPVMPGFRTLLDELRRRVPEEIAGAAVAAAALDPVFEA